MKVPLKRHLNIFPKLRRRLLSVRWTLLLITTAMFFLSAASTGCPTGGYSLSVTPNLGPNISNPPAPSNGPAALEPPAAPAALEPPAAPAALEPPAAPAALEPPAAPVLPPPPAAPALPPPPEPPAAPALPPPPPLTDPTVPALPNDLAVLPAQSTDPSAAPPPISLLGITPIVLPGVGSAVAIDPNGGNAAGGGGGNAADGGGNAAGGGGNAAAPPKKAKKAKNAVAAAAAGN